MVRSNVNLDRSLQPHQLQIIQTRPYSDGVHLPCNRSRTTVDNFYGRRRIAQEALKDPNFPIAPQVDRVAELSQMPNGYSLWRIDKPTPPGRANANRNPTEPEYMVAGHPTGLFTSVKKFMVHFIYIQIHGNKHACPCDRCVAERKQSANLQNGTAQNAAPQNVVDPNVAPAVAAPNMAAANMGAPYLANTTMAAPNMAAPMMAGQPLTLFATGAQNTAVSLNISNLQAQGVFAVPPMAPQQLMGLSGLQATATTLPAGQLPLPSFTPHQHLVGPIVTAHPFAGPPQLQPNAHPRYPMPPFPPVRASMHASSQAALSSAGATAKSSTHVKPLHRRHDSLLSNASSTDGLQGAAAAPNSLKGKAALYATQTMPRSGASGALQAMRAVTSASQDDGMNAYGVTGYGPLDKLEQEFLDTPKTRPTNDFGAELDLFSPANYCIRCDTVHRHLEDCPHHRA